MILIGYSGHGFVAYGIFHAAGIAVAGYCDREEKQYNPFNLIYLGPENSHEALAKLVNREFFISIGDNKIRRKIYTSLEEHGLLPASAIHPSAWIDPTATIDPYGVMVGAGSIINPLVHAGKGVICNSGCIIEHECVIDDFAHIGPGAVLCGNVKVGEGSFVGAASVIREGVTIGKNAMIGAGAVVVKNIGDNEIVVGNPSRKFEKKI
jgi:sugar O-acyltransferase (sialic acid O-acetyltransferase NeuD family)